MKKKMKILIFNAIFIFALAITFNINMQKKTGLFSVLELANLEALASEIPTGLTGGYARTERYVPSGASASGSIQVGANSSGGSVGASGSVTIQYKVIVCCIESSNQAGACDWDLADPDCLKF